MNSMLSEALQQFVGLLNQLLKNLLGNDAELWGNELKKFLRKEPCWVEVKRVVESALLLISRAEQIIIPATAGTKTIAQAADVFTWYIDQDFKNWGLDVSEEAKPATPVQVYEMIKDGDYKSIFGSFGQDLDKLCFTQEQIIAFVRNHKKWLRIGGYATFFLFKVGNEFFVAYVRLDAGGRPDASVYRFSRGDVWSGDDRRRVVVPQLTL